MGPHGKFDPSKVEAEIDNLWESKNLNKKVKESRKGGRNYYLTRSPILIRNEPRWEDIYRLILSDVWSRFQSMRDYNVRCSIGFDPMNYGLERSFLLKKRAEDFEDISYSDVRDVIDPLQKHIDTHEKRNKDKLRSLGLWYLKDDIYSTGDKEYLDSMWWTFKEIYEAGLIEKRKEPILWCPDCEISVSDAEVVLKDDVIEEAIIKVPIKKGKKRFLLVEASNSWTIPSSPSLVINPDLEYSSVAYKKDGEVERAVVLDGKVEEIMEKGDVEKYKILNTVKGSKLEGMQYEFPLLEKVPYHQDLEGEHIHRVILSDKVGSEGTGIFFLTPSHDRIHWEIALDKDIDPYTPVEYTGKYDSDLRKTKYSGFPAINSDSMILNDLESQDNIFYRVVKDSKIKLCSHCSNQVLWMPEEELFYKTSEMKDEVKITRDRIHWIPEKEESDKIYLDDWYISRDGDMGVPIPLWTCECGNTYVPEDREDLSDTAEYNKKEYPYTLVLDELEMKCEECGKSMTRVKKVFNTLFTSSASPWAQLSYPQNQYEYQSWWPGKLFFSRTGLDHTDIFTANISLSNKLFDSTSIENMFIHGNVETEFDEMPTSKLNEIGYDSLRTKLLSDKPPWDDRKLNEDELDKTSKLVRVLWNIYDYTDELIRKNEFEPDEVTLEYLEQYLPPEDEWLLSRLEDLKRETKNSFKKSRFDKAISVLREFVVDDLAQWYISVARARDKNEEERNKQALMKVLYETTLTLSQLSTPIIPHTSEKIYRGLKGKEESVFLNKWPSPKKIMEKKDVEEEMGLVRDIVNDILEYKRQSELPLKWPLKRIIIDCEKEGIAEIVLKYAHIIINKGKVKDIDLVEPGEEWHELKLKVQPNKNAIGRTYKQWESRIATMLKQRPPEEIRIGIENGEYTMGIEGQIIEIQPDMVTFETELQEGFHQLDFDGFKVYLDLEITDELWEEQIAKEVLLRLKSMKNEFTLEENDEVEVYIDASNEIVNSVERNKGKIIDELNVKSLHLKDEEMDDAEYVLEWDIHDESVYLGMTPLYKSKVLEVYKMIPGMDEETAEKLYEEGYTSLELLGKASASELSSLPGLKRSMARRIVHGVREEKEDLVQGEKVERKEISVEEQKRKMREPHRAEQPEAEIKETEEEEVEVEMPEGISISSTYLILEKGSERSFKLFKNILDTGLEGLCVTRDYPEKVKKKYGLEDVSMIWLSNVDREDVIRPKNLEKFSLKLEKFLTDNGGVILLNGLEYLITNNDFRTVLHLIQSIKDQVAINESILMIPVNPTTLEEHQLDLMESEVDEILENK